MLMVVPSQVSVRPCAQFWPLSLFPLFGSLLSLLCLLPPYTHACNCTVLSLAFQAPLISQSLLDLDSLSLDLTFMENIDAFGQPKFFLLLLLLLILLSCFLFVMRL